MLCCAGLASPQSWTPLKNQPTTFAPIMNLLLTDGTVIVEDANTCTTVPIQVPKRPDGTVLPATPQEGVCQWYRLTPIFTEAM
jgi:hypothetical protein